MNQRPIYLDYNATTPIDPAVVDAMLPFLREQFGNASSGHAYGLAAHHAMERARAQVAGLIGAQPDEVVFTGGGSESDNLALKGAVFANLEGQPHIVASAVEHPAILNTLAYLRRRFGARFTLVPVDAYGVVDVEAVRNAIRPQTVLVTVMHANNEVGTIQPIRQIAEVARERGALMHVDAAQSAGKIPVHVEDLGADLLTLAAHKVYAPKGIGALYVRSGTRIDPLIHGAGHERGRRAGTENVASMVGFGVAAELAAAGLEKEGSRLSALRDLLHRLLAERIPGLQLNGHPAWRLPNTLNVSFPGAIGEAVLACAPDVAASTGAACHAGSTEPSGALMAMGLPVERALGAVRLSLGRWSTDAEIARAAEALVAGYAQVAPRAQAAR